MHEYKRKQDNNLPWMPWYWSQTTEITEWQWNTEILNSIVEGSFCFLFPLSLSLTHISTSFSYNSFLAGLSHTQRKPASFSFAGKTLCLTCRPSHLIAERTSDRHHSSVTAVFPMKLDTPLESYSTQWHRDTAPKISETYMLPLAAVLFFSFVLCIQNTRFRILAPAHLSRTPKQSHTGRKEESLLIFWFSLQIFEITCPWTAKRKLPWATGDLSFSTCYIRIP